MKSPQIQLNQVLLQAPPGKKFLLLPIAYTLFLQIITGIPKPGTLKNIDANELLVRFSTELFDYPYWLQDLSHLPLFFVLGWLWLWTSPKPYAKGFLRDPAFLFALSYACFNELVQAFIPQRFPSVGDLLMNLLGVTLARFAHHWSYRRSVHR